MEYSILNIQHATNIIHIYIIALEPYLYDKRFLKHIFVIDTVKCLVIFQGDPPRLSS